jgi:hypothetical protein
VITFPEAAKNAFSSTANELLAAMQDCLLSPPDPNHLKTLEIHPSHVFRSEDLVGAPQFTQKEIDSAGNETGRFWDSEGRRSGWNGEAYQKMKRLAERIARTKELRGFVSESFILDELFDWLRQTLQRTRSDTLGDFIAERATAEIRDHEIWVPLYRTYSSIDFAIGEVTFRSITKQFLDGWLLRAKPADAAAAERVQQLEQKMRANHQASLAACVRVRAEKRKALEVALEKTETATALLRFLSFTNWICNRRSYSTLFGMQNIQSWYSFHLQDGASVNTQNRPAVIT